MYVVDMSGGGGDVKVVQPRCLLMCFTVYDGRKRGKWFALSLIIPQQNRIKKTPQVSPRRPEAKI